MTGGPPGSSMKQCDRLRLWAILAVGTMSTLAHAGPNPHHRYHRHRLWGDGLVEQSLSSLWYGASWKDVDSDELIFFMPALAARQDSQVGVAAHIGDALLRRTQSAVTIIRQILRPNEVCSDAELARLIETWAALTPASLANEPVRRSEPLSRRMTGACLWSRMSNARRLRASVIHELSVLNRLERMLQDSKMRDEAERPGSNRAVDASETDALVTSIHSAINAAYVYPQFAPSQELFSVAAWIGLLHAGRPALLPLSIAETLMEFFERWASGKETTLTDEVLSYHAAVSAGVPQLKNKARKVMRSGSAAVVRPLRFSLLSKPPLPPVWNPSLAEDISLRLSRYRSAA